ncbi:MAG: hypothetical protein IPP79_09955 [Chitinophagaceae bacterium]|nr:hypothetical protein [Chitinophagaceae bacterium]
MKRSIILLLVAMLFVISNFIGCKHDMSLTCEEIHFSITATGTDALLNSENGSITVSASGGKQFQYSLNGGPFIDTGYFSGLAPFKEYRVIGHNSTGCSDTVMVSIGSLDPCKGITIAVSATKVDASANQSNGSISATATGASGITYSLNGGAFQSTGTFNNLAPGDYTITAKTAAGCLGFTQTTIGTLNPCAGVTVAVTSTQVNPTTGQSNGSITASATGGSGFTYSINNGAFQNSGTFTGLATGNYTITAKNSNGCTGVTTVALGATNPCAGITVTVTTSQVNPSTGQSNGSITASATGGTGFTYSVNGGAYQTSGTFSNLGAGTYTITAKNSNGCLGTKAVTLSATSTCTSVNITITPAVTNVVPCSTPAANGSITITAAGSSGYTYNKNGGAYQASNVFPSLTAGSYLMGVKDANGCTKTQTVTVSASASGPLFAAVRNLITTRCSSGSGCHMNGGSAAGYNFDNDCNIVTYWSQINNSCVTYTLKKMPISPQALLTTTEKAVITNWVNAGHKFTN